MSTAANERLSVLDIERAREEWARSLPTSLPEDLLAPRDLDRLLRALDRFLRTGAAEALADLEADVYRIALRLEPRVGRDAALRYLRDAPARILLERLRRVPDLVAPLARIVARLSDAVWNAHTDALQETIRRQQDERLHEELMIAKQIQERLLPRAVPTVPGYQIAGRVLPAAEVGGDYWSCKSYPEDDIVTFKLADITGHGIAAATLVAAVKFISGGYYRGAKTAAQVVERTNDVLVRETPHEILVTMVYGWLYPYSHEMSVVNAGHSPVFHYRNGRFRDVLPGGLALGLMETRYREVRLEMEPGDVFFTCSDGVTEPSAENALGEEWVREQVAAGAGGSAAELVERVLDGALRAYGVPRDDMSVLVIKRTD